MATCVVVALHGLGDAMILRVHRLSVEVESDDPQLFQTWKLYHPARNTRFGWFQLRHRELHPLLTALEGQSYEVVVTALQLAVDWQAHDVTGVVPTARRLCAGPGQLASPHA